MTNVERELANYLCEFDPATGTLVFLSALAINFLATRSQQANIEGRRIRTGVLDTSVLLLNAITIYSFVANPLYILPEAAGCFLGAVTGVRKKVRPE